jgi:hypothetical protein
LGLVKTKVESGLILGTGFELDLVQVQVSKNQSGIRSDFWNWFWNWIWFRLGLVKTKVESGLIFGTGFGTGSVGSELVWFSRN